MNKALKTIMIPWDFTSASENAILHAILLKRGSVDITLVHVVEKSSQIEGKTAELNDVVQELATKHNIEKPKTLVRKGNIFKHLSSIAVEINAILVIMGIHDIQNKRGIKVVLGSQVPFILVKIPPKRNEYKNIVVPFDEDEKNRIQLNWIINLAKYYNCNIDIIKPFINSNVKNEKMRNQMFFIKKNLDAKDIVYGVRTAKRGVEFHDAMFNFVEEIDADIIMMMAGKFKKYIKGIKNNTVPVMCINSKLANLGGFN